MPRRARRTPRGGYKKGYTARGKRRRLGGMMGSAGRRRLANARTGGFLGIERKFFDVQQTATALSLEWATSEPATTNLTAVAQGDGESERDGRKYVIDSIHIKGFIETAALESQPGPIPDIIVRICLVWDQQTNGAQLTATDVMVAGRSDPTQSFRNLQFTKRFIVLWDKTFKIVRDNINEGAVNLFAAAVTRSYPFKINKTFGAGMQVTMSGTTANIANVVDNSIHLIAAASDVQALLSYQCRIRFKG